MSPASLPLKDESLDLLSAKGYKRKIVTRRSSVSARHSALYGEADGGTISGNQEDNSFASFLSFESSAENEREIPASRNTEDYEGLPLESVRNDGKGDTHVPFSSDEAGPSSILSSTSSNSSDSLVLNSAEGVNMACLRDDSSGFSEETEPTEMFLATGSGFSDGITSGNTRLNTGSFEEEIPLEAQFSDSEDNVTDGVGNNETVVDDMQGTSIESCNGEISSSWSGPRASPALAGSDSGINSSGSSSYHCRLTGHKGLIVDDGNQLTLQHNSIKDDQRSVGKGECDPDCSSKTGNQLPPLRNSKEHDQRPEEWCEAGSDSSSKTGNQLPLQQNSHEHDQQTDGRREPGSESSSKSGNQLLLQRNSNEYDQRTEGRREPGSDSSSETGNKLLLQRNSNETGNQIPPRQNSSEPDQLTEGSRAPDAASSSERNWERQGARPKRTQTQHPVDPPLWPSSSPVSDGLAKDFLARHSQDRAVQESLYTDDRELSSVGPERLPDSSFVDDLTSASEAYSAMPYCGAMGASPHERFGGAFSDVPSSRSAARAGLLGGSPTNESFYSSSTHATAAPLPSFTGPTQFSSVLNGISGDGINTSNRLLPSNDFSTSGHCVTGKSDFSGEWDSPLDQNLRSYRLSLQQINTSISPNSRFVYGSNSSGFAAGMYPGCSIYGAQRHVLSDGNSVLIDDQRSHNGNLNLESKSSQFGDREQAEGSFAANGVVVGSRNFLPPFTDSLSTVPCNMVVLDSTSRSSIAVASNITSTVVNANKNSVLSPTLAGDGNEETSLLPVSGEVNFKATSSNRDYGRNTVEPNDNSLAASEQRTAEDASALVERRLRDREEREEFMKELQRKEQMIREEREREKREKEDREWQEAEKWPPQQEGVSTGSRWLCEHYQRRCRVRFPCCTQFYPCHRCHNSSSNCKNDEAKACHATHLKCSLCQFEQEVSFRFPSSRVHVMVVGSLRSTLATAKFCFEITFSWQHWSRGFNKFFEQGLLEVERVTQTTKGADGEDSFPLWGSGDILPQKNLKFRSSEMQFTAFCSSKTMLFMINSVGQ